MVNERENAVSPEMQEEEGALEDRVNEEAGTRNVQQEDVPHAYGARIS